MDPTTGHARFATNSLRTASLVELPVFANTTVRTEQQTSITCTHTTQLGVSASMYPIVVKVRVRFDDTLSDAPVMTPGTGAIT